MDDTAYTIKITDPNDPHFGEVGRLKDQTDEKPTLYFIRFPGGEGDWYFKSEFIDLEAIRRIAEAK